MTDILIRGVEPATLARVDARAASLGLTRGDYLRRRIEADAGRAEATVTMDHLQAFAVAGTGLLDHDLMTRAWS